MDERPLVSVGIPCYNRPEGLRRTLECITGQTYDNLEIIISDNCSPDPEVEKIAGEYIKIDSRVSYFRQTVNEGPINNFKFVLRKAKGDFFMWASDDDLWDPDFVFSLMSILKENPDASFSFCRFEAIDFDDNIIYQHSSFSRFKGENIPLNSCKFFLEPEITGKACIIYSIFRRKYLLDVVSSGCMDNGYWGFDNSLILGCLARGHFISVDEILMRKRISVDDESDVKEMRRAMQNPYRHSVQLLEFGGYISNCLRATRGTICLSVILLATPVKFLFSLYSSLFLAVQYLSSHIRKTVFNMVKR